MVNFMDLRKLSITNNHFIMVSISMLILLGFWQLISLFYPEQFLPSPVTTGRVILNLILERDAAYHIYVSLYRIVFSFIWSMLGGILIGIVMGVNRVAESLMRTWVVVGLTIPFCHNSDNPDSNTVHNRKHMGRCEIC
jgi:NitT/TauT family transport system permease protein